MNLPHHPQSQTSQLRRTSLSMKTRFPSELSKRGVYLLLGYSLLPMRITWIGVSKSGGKNKAELLSLVISSFSISRGSLVSVLSFCFIALVGFIAHFGFLAHFGFIAHFEFSVLIWFQFVLFEFSVLLILNSNSGI